MQSQRDSDQENHDFLSRSFKSKEEFVVEYKKLYHDNAKAKILYLHLLTELEKTFVTGNFYRLQKLSRMISYISNVEGKKRLKAFYENKENPLRTTNLLILACKYHNVKILKYIITNNINILNNHSFKVGKISLLPDDIDEAGHNAFYYAIRSGSVDILEILIDKWPKNYFEFKKAELEIILSKAYEELKLKNVLLSEEMENAVESKLIDLRFYAKRTNQVKSAEEELNCIKERIELVVEKINLLNAIAKVDESFLFTAKFIACNIYVLKQQLKYTYDRLPWEEIEFCLICFISSHTKQQEINFFYRATLNKSKILNHLNNFADKLRDEKDGIKSIDDSKFVLSNLKREKVILDIVDCCPQFEELYNDYQFIRDVSSLEKISNYLDLASSVDTKELEGQLVITRVLQVMGEHLKNSLESPKLSSAISEILLLSLPMNKKTILIDLRNSLSHIQALTQRTEIEENTDVNFFIGIQKDVAKISNVITDVLFKNKIKMIRILLKKVNSGSLSEIMEVAEVLKNIKFDKLKGRLEKMELKSFETLISELNNRVTEKTEFEKTLFKKIKDVINLDQVKFTNTRTDYCMVLTALEQFNYIVLNYQMHSNNIRVINFHANLVLKLIAPELEPQSFKEIAELSKKIIQSVFSRTQQDDVYEIYALLCEILLIAEFWRDNMNCIENLRDKFNKKSYIKNKINKTFNVPKEKFSIQIERKISDLISILAKNVLCSHDFACYKCDKKLQAVIEMLVLDIMTILGSSNYLANNNFFLDNSAPLLIGKCLRNHLAHDNAIVDVLLSDPSIAVLLNAKKLVSENVIKKKNKIGNYIREDPSKLRDKYDQGLVAITNQERMFVALEEGNLEELKNCINNGADLNARNVNMWTSVHFATKGPCLQVIKFIHGQNLKFNVNNRNSQTPLHIAATYGIKGNVEFLVEVAGLHVDDFDDAFKTPLHFAAQNGHKDTVKVLLKKKANSFAKDGEGSSALHLAVLNNFKEVVEALLINELNVNINKTKGGFTSLHIASENGHLELVKFLLKKDADVNAKTDKKVTSLHLAALNGHLEIVIALLDNGADFNAKGIDGNTPLHYAVENGHVKVVDILLEHGVNVNVACTTYNNTPLHIAANDGYEEIVNSLLNNGAIANATTVEGLTPLCFAIQKGHVRIVATLLKYGVDINISPLHIAAACGQKDVADILIKNKVDVNARDNYFTPLHLAAMKNHLNVIDLLIEKKAEIQAKDESGITALHSAAMNGNIDVISILIKNKAEVNATSYSGATPLHFAAMNINKDVIIMLKKNSSNYALTPLCLTAAESSSEAVEYLILNGAEVNATDNFGFTPLHAAVVGEGAIDSINILIKYHAEVNARDFNGSTPLHFAVVSCHVEVIKVLLCNGSDVNAYNKFNRTPLFNAIKPNNERIVEVLIANGANTDAEVIQTSIRNNCRDIVEILMKNNVDPNKNCLQNITLLHLAVESGNAKIVSALIRKGADVNAKSGEGTTPIYIAARDGKCDVVKVLLKNGAKINIRDYKKRTPIEIAVAFSRLLVVKILIQFKELDVNAKFNDGFTLLHIAALSGSLEITKLLIEYGANINAKNYCGSKPIHIAAREGSIDIVKFYISIGVSICNLGVSNSTLLHYAALGGQSELGIYLIEQGLDVNITNDLGETPLHLAAHLGHKDVIIVLINNGAVYNAVDNFNRKPLNYAQDTEVINLLISIDKLFEAVKCNSSSEVKKCINEGAIVNANNALGETPLHIAAWKGYESIVDILLKNKGNPNAVGKEGFTPMHYAAKFFHLKIVKLLLAYGAKYNVCSNSGKTPLDFANDKDIISLINLVNESFKNVTKGNIKIIYKLNKKVKDIDTIKAVMNARDRENRSIVVVAMICNFRKIEELKQIAQNNISYKVKKALKLLSQDNYQEALNLFRNAFEIRKEILGPDNPGTLDIQIYIANVLYKLGIYQEALDIYEEISQKQEQMLGANFKDTLSTRSSIALVHHRIGKYEEALNIYKEVFRRQKDTLGPNDLDTLYTQLHMALVLESLGKYEEALNINRTVFIKLKEILGAYHGVTLCAQNNIAMVLGNQGKYEDALNVYKEVYEKRKIVLGIHHSDTLRTLHNVVMTRVNQNKCHDSLKDLEELLITQKNILGPYHVDTLCTEYNVANLLLFQGMNFEALKAFKSFEQRKAILGSDHPYILDTTKKIECIYNLFKLQSYNETDINLYLNNDLNVAANNGDLKMVQKLIKFGADVNEKDIEGRAPLHFAADYGSIDVVKVLMKNGADVTQVTCKGNTPLHTAASKGYKNIVEVLLQHVNHKKQYLFIDAKTTVQGTTSLHVASKNGSIDVVMSLLKYGATYNFENKEGKTPLDLSKDINISNLLKLVEELFEDSKIGNVQIIEKLKSVEPNEFRAVINTRNEAGKTLVQVAAMNQHRDIASKIIKTIKNSGN